MSKSAFTDAHRAMVAVLKKARLESGIDQADVAAKLGKNQSFISNIERGQRRVDMVEFFAIAKAINQNPVDIFIEISNNMPDIIEI